MVLGPKVPVRFVAKKAMVMAPLTSTYW